MQRLMVVVCGEGFHPGNRPMFGPAFRAAPARICPIAKLQFLLNSHTRPDSATPIGPQVTSLFREAEVYAVHNRKREATYI